MWHPRDAYEVLGVSRNSTENQVCFFDFCFWLWFSVLWLMRLMLILILKLGYFILMYCYNHYKKTFILRHWNCDPWGLNVAMCLFFDFFNNVFGSLGNHRNFFFIEPGITFTSAQINFVKVKSPLTHIQTMPVSLSLFIIKK